KPDTGSIRLGGQVLTQTRSRTFLPPEQRGVGLLFQDHCLFPHLRVKSNITYGLRRRPAGGVPLDRLVKTLELDEVLDRFPRHLSGGQKQRVALARAIASGP